MTDTVRAQLPAIDPATGSEVDGVALLTIDRPRALNALDRSTMQALVATLTELDASPECRCVVITGAGERAFAAGADIREMADRTSADVLADDFLAPWDLVAGIGVPLIAAVRGFCLGGGFELALACDIVIAADDAVFGLPEITLGIMPGAGGTQRLTRTVGKSRAMELILTGSRIPAADAERWGIAGRVVPSAAILTEALSLAASIASMPTMAVRAATAAIDAAHELPLREGIADERRWFAGLFDTADQKEGMRAFLERRPPRWSGR
jgi:enoyl-CoA hydratase